MPYLKQMEGEGRGAREEGRTLCTTVHKINVALWAERALDLFSEHYMDLQGCQLLLKAQTVFLRSLCRVLNEAQRRCGGGEWHVRYIAILTVKYDLLTSCPLIFKLC